jgi:hypothetical protein
MRKYERLYCCPKHGPLIAGRRVCGWIGKDEESGETVGCKLAEPVTATDDRDVMPLVEAARSVLGQRRLSAGFSCLPDNPVVRGKLDALAAALEPFETEETP